MKKADLTAEAHQINRIMKCGLVHLREHAAWLANADPTSSKSYTLWLARQYARGMFVFPQMDDPYFGMKLTASRHHLDVVRTALQKFDDAKKRKKLADPDINHYTYATLLDTIEMLSNGIELVVDGPTWSVYRISTPEACAITMQHTSWCTKNYDDASKYLSSGPLYLIKHCGKTFALAHDPTGYINDVHNGVLYPKNPMELYDVLRQAGLKCNVGHLDRIRMLARCGKHEISGVDIAANHVQDHIENEILNEIHEAQLRESNQLRHYGQPAIVQFGNENPMGAALVEFNAVEHVKISLAMHMNRCDVMKRLMREGKFEISIVTTNALTINAIAVISEIDIEANFDGCCIKVHLACEQRTDFEFVLS